MEIILFEPEIPQNTGNVVRTCAVTGTRLTLVRPLGFSLSDRWLKRAGLDYWKEVEMAVIDDLEAHLAEKGSRFFFFSSHAKAHYTSISFTPSDLCIFGSETKGLPQPFFEKWNSLFFTIPMKAGARCLNLSNSVAVVLYEALRQQNFILQKG
ncbi:MAG: tRNA (uridine(34)/cytosine(34)/5-carboxymethylaminomethyluridine(34)-2'-O)-methyltransferase TrmL [Chlamydiae bacterium GWA2_50_15]|nr:MAG: tRNA (uridine(34)/cytosine(34)/5-carboxymethylaminomethyluridine(34)-2'-O)-methyltransferase TrmL [Chlamydiae bacterium GWA2_50_15]OGN54378.1 MAG: tRNA (uridine(34)/cytosine(34)/5-carboxymethylaminomethyluridine(34)-2'-O)-methyltransferase TrmL [Chlamydiae bacterium GWF2_49_8]OGN58789.1 MAG: tRNA (uridine(34)/cytosine(34)/5-carboxymethylaminomethyluridine(34)-2'-O)-methyltransferase TrmL [Chlamydiae bacterium RIFCSPHIGHO2_02_FULL_49_29]OGN64011.1 MAG: tRNA (uridine(34)/cytosine(34)/5-car